MKVIRYEAVRIQIYLVIESLRLTTLGISDRNRRKTARNKRFEMGIVCVVLKDCSAIPPSIVNMIIVIRYIRFDCIFAWHTLKSNIRCHCEQRILDTIFEVPGIGLETLTRLDSVTDLYDEGCRWSNRSKRHRDDFRILLQMDRSQRLRQAHRQE